MGHLLIAALLVACMAPAFAATDSTLQARPPPEGATAERSSGARGVVAPPVAQAIGGARARRLSFVGAVVTPAGGAHPAQPVIRVREIVQTISEDDYRVLEVVYR